MAETIFYRRKDGKVVRRVYRTLAELEEIQRNVVLGISRLDYSAQEIAERIQRKQELLDSLRENATPDMPIGKPWVSKKNKLRRVMSALEAIPLSADNALLGGQVQALFARWGMGGEASTEAHLDADLEHAAGLLKQWQAELRKEWTAQNTLERLTQKYAAGVPVNLEMQEAADLQRLGVEEFQRRKEADLNEFGDLINQQPTADAKVATAEALIAQQKQEIAELRHKLAVINQNSAMTNTPAALIANGFQTYTPRTPEEAANVQTNAGFWNELVDGAKKVVSVANETGLSEWAGKRVTKLGDKALGQIGKAGGDYVAAEMKAEAKFNYQQRLAKLEADVQKVVQDDQLSKQERLSKAQALKDVLLTLEGQVNKKQWQQAYGWLHAWALDTGRNTYSEIKAAIQQMSDGVDNPRSKAYIEDSARGWTRDPKYND